jgi:hypothetical protein
MATTYTATTNLRAAGVADLPSETHTKTGTLAGDSDIHSATQDVGTSSEAIATGEIAAGSCAFIEITNLDSTNFLSVGFNNPAVAGTETFKVKAGQSALFPNPSAALYAIADTATVKVHVKAVEL